MALAPNSHRIPLLKLANADIQRFGHLLASIANGTTIRSAFDYGFVRTPVMDWSDHDRTTLLDWIQKLPEVSSAKLDEIADRATNIRPMDPKIYAVPEDGRINLGFEFYCKPVNNVAALAYMVAGILDAGYAKNLRICPHCGNWFFDVPSGRPIKRYCKTSHERSARQKRYRERQKKKGQRGGEK